MKVLTVGLTLFVVVIFHCNDGAAGKKDLSQFRGIDQQMYEEEIKIKRPHVPKPGKKGD